MASSAPPPRVAASPLSVEAGDPYVEAKADLDATVGSARTQIAALLGATETLRDAARGTLPAGLRRDPLEALSHAEAQTVRVSGTLAAAHEESEIVQEIVDLLRARPVTRYGVIVPQLEIERRAEYIAGAKAKLKEWEATVQSMGGEIEQWAAELRPHSSKTNRAKASEAPVDPSSNRVPQQQQSSGAKQAAGLPPQRIQRHDGGAGTSDAGVAEELEAHRQLRTEIATQNEEALDRIHAGVRRAHQNALLTKETLTAQDETVVDIDEMIDRNTTGLAMLMKKTNYLLEHASDKGKICTIVCLCFVLGILIAILLTI